MATITDNLRLDIPEDGDDGETYSEKVRDSFTRIDLHDHTDEFGVRIPVEGIDIQGSLEFNNQAATEVGYVGFQDQSTTVSGAVYANRLYVAGGDLVFNDVDGNPTLVGASGASGTFIQDGVGAVIRTSQEKQREVVSILDFLDGSDVRSAIINAHAYLASRDGGALYWPSRATSYDVNNTGLGPIDWTSDGIWWVGDSSDGTIIRNTSTDATDFISFNGITNSIQRCGWRNLKLDSLSTAGHIFTFTSKGLSYSRFENVHVRQQALAKSIMVGTFTDTGGMFENQWVGGIWEHGTSSTRATAIAFDLRSNTNLITLNKWQDMRFHCHDSQNYFFRIECTAGASGPSNHQNEWRGINTEVCTGGFVWILGCAQSIFSDIVPYDSHVGAQGVVRDYIREDTGSGGKICEGTIYYKVASSGGYLEGVTGTSVSVSSITRTGTTATVSATAHGLTTGQVAYLEGADQADYNGRFEITRINNNSFSFEVDAGAVTPATGTITTSSGTMDIRLGSGSNMAMFIGCAGLGTASPVEIDLANRGATIIGDNALRASLYRVDENTTTVLGQGTGAHVSTGIVYADDIQERTAGAGVTCSGVFIAQDGVQFGAGETIKWSAKSTQAINPTSVSANSSLDTAVTIAGVATGDRVIVNPNSAPETGLGWCAFASATDEVTLRLTNSTGSPIDPASRNWSFTILRH